MENEIIHKELDIIQSIITRMSNNSFLLKGWLISIVVAVLALTRDTLVTNDVTYLSIILLLPLLVFWYLDAYYLHKERCFRKIYEWVIKNRANTNDNLYSLDYTRFKEDVDSISKIMWSSTLKTFYGTTAIILVVITIYNLLN